MQEQEKWFDGPVKLKTPETVRDELATIAGQVLESKNAIKGPASKAVGEIRQLISVKESSPNAGYVPCPCFDMEPGLTST